MYLQITECVCQCSIAVIYTSLANFEVNSLTISDPGDISEYDGSLIFPSLPLAIKWLRESALQNRSTQFQV